MARDRPAKDRRWPQAGMLLAAEVVVLAIGLSQVSSSGDHGIGGPSSTTVAPDGTSRCSDDARPERPASAPTSGPAAGRCVAFADEFDTLSVGPGMTWGYTTAAYAQANRNPKDHKLDWTASDAMHVADGVLVIAATPHDDHYWNTGLLTTEPSATGGNGFRVQAGDFLVTHVRMPSGNSGGWPALWTWLGDNGEIDAFEWHSDNPHLLELSNRIRPASGDHTSDSLVAPGRWVWIGVQLGADNDSWYVGPDLGSMTSVFHDGNGIGTTRPYIIESLSVSDGTFHERPSGSAAITCAIDSIRVYR